jgi:vitamin B12 transporter
MNNTLKTSILTCLILSKSLFANDGRITVSSATKSKQSIKDITSNVEVITGAQLQIKQITTVVDALKYMNISVNQSGGLGQTSSFFMQGMSAEHTLVMVDGIRYNDPTVTNGYALLETLSISNISRIEIITGAQSGIWGSDAAAGVINIITNKESTHNLNLNIEAGSFNTRKLNVAISDKDEHKYINLNVSSITSDGFTAIKPKDKDINDFEDDGYKNHTIAARFGFNINDNNKIDLSHSIINAKGDYDNSFAVDSANDDASTYKTNNTYSKLNYHNTNKLGSLDIYKKMSLFDREVGEGVYKGNTSEIGVKAQLNYNKNSFVILGADQKNQELESSYSALKGDYKSNGLFITNSASYNGFIPGDTIFTQSLRIDRFDKFEDKATGKIGIKHHFHTIQGLTSAINYGTAYKAPSLYNLYAQFGAGNINLIPEDIKTIDFSLKYKTLSLKFFKSEIEDEILYSNTSFSYIQSQGESQYKGYSIGYKDTLFKTLLLSANYANQSAKDKDGNDLKRRIAQSGKLVINYFGIKKFNFGVDLNYIGERYDDDKKTQQTGKYTLMNAVVNYKLNKSINTYVKINNLTNKQYQEVEGYASSPRAYYVGLNAKF